MKQVLIKNNFYKASLTMFNFIVIRVDERNVTNDHFVHWTSEKIAPLFSLFIIVIDNGPLS